MQFKIKQKQNTTPNIYLKNELLKYEDEAKFLGVTFDSKLSFKNHIEDIIKRSRKKLNLLKALRGRTWGANPETILHSYRSYIRPLLEYSCILFAHADKQLQTKIQSIETEAIKIAFNLAPWTSNYWCYTKITFTPVLSRMKSLSKDFLDKKRKDQLISELINNSKHSNLGLHSPVFKALNW